jgi:hypothetical protein
VLAPRCFGVDEDFHPIEMLVDRHINGKESS